MASITRWDPFRDLLSLQNEMTRLFSQATSGTEGGGSELFAQGWVPPMDVLEEQDRYVVTMELPGITPDQVDVTFNDGVLTVRGERKFYEGRQENDFHRVERRYGAFARSITLPQTIDPEKIDAQFSSGLLTLAIPKAETAKPRRIEVKATS
jgi:HSP20 family protein